MLFPHNIILGLLAGLFTLNSAQAIEITASTDWETCQLQDNVTDAGTYYSNNIDSSTLTLSCANAHLSISGAATSTTPWTVTSRLINSLSGINLDLLRHGNGSGDSTPTGGDSSYTTQTTAAQTFFSGQGNVSQIPLRFRVRNFDVSDGNGTKNIQLSYEITTN